MMKFTFGESHIKIPFFTLCVFFALLLLSACKSDDVTDGAKQIPVSVDMIAFDLMVSEASAKDLPLLREKFPALLPKRIPDSLWLSKINGTDTIYDVLEKAVLATKFDRESLREESKTMMQYIKYYFPEYEPTDVLTLISEVSYQRPVIPTPQYLIVGVDNYLGSSHSLYEGIYQYQVVTMNEANMIPDMALALANDFVEPSADRSLLGWMVYHGKLHYLQSLFAPKREGHLYFGYDADKYVFAQNSTEEMWRFFIDQDLLFDTDPSLYTRFIGPAPFSKFYLDIDQETPGGVGRYIGFALVKAYMENNDVSLRQMLALPAAELLTNSGFKP